ncbi:hypothetical protein Gotur_022541 [Gossypium turneri]
MPKPCPRHGLTWDVLISVPMPCPRHGLTGDLSSRCQRHVPDMVLHGTSHLGANAMSQTWSYMGPLISVPMPCPRHGLTWDLSSWCQCHVPDMYSLTLAESICQKRKEANKLNQELELVDCVDLLTSYITEKESTGLKCDDKFLRDAALNMIIAATDTTSTALTWFTWLVKNLVYLHGALCEALRLYPPVPFNHKEPVKPDMLPSGQEVHPKTKILFSVYSMGRMKSIWGEDCYEFKPERWINERGEIKHEPSYKFLSFGAGPRICLGKETSFIQMKAVASALIYYYRIHVMEETLIVPTVSVVLHTKNGLMTRISKRWE